jgi:hypothetical protein
MTDSEVRRWLRVHEQRMAACKPGGAIHDWYLAILDECRVGVTCDALGISRQTSVNWRRDGIPVEQVQRLAEIRKAVR